MGTPAIHLLIPVALGGALGATLRHIMVSMIGVQNFPLGTLAVNVIGSFILGVLIEVFALLHSPSDTLRAFMVIGVMGSFTTFSAFSLDTWHLYQHGAWGAFFAYVAGSFILSVGGLVLAMMLLRTMLS